MEHLPLSPRDSKIQNRFTGPNGLIESRNRMVDSERDSVERGLSRGNIPHLGMYAEAMAKRRYMTLVRSALENGRSWSDALDAVRRTAMDRLTDFNEDSDPWERANGWSHRIAAAWFLKETDDM